jgi:ABC-type molybdate transport system permease subunit
MQEYPDELIKLYLREYFCTPVEMLKHVAIETVVAIFIGVLLSLILRREHDWGKELIEFFLGGVLGGIVVVAFICLVILR